MNKLLKQIRKASNTHVFTAAKDKSGKYIYCNENVAEALGLDSPNHIIGKTDYELCWHDQAKIYIASDQRVMSGYPYINIINPQTQITGLKKVLSSKSSLLNDHAECIGIVVSYIDVSKYFVKEKTLSLRTINGKRFYLGSIFGNEYLTNREVQILQMILLGMCNKKIAKLLTIAQKTVEAHIDHLKAKLQCHSKGDIIMTALKTGLTFTILDVDNWDNNYSPICSPCVN